MLFRFLASYLLFFLCPAVVYAQPSHSSQVKEKRLRVSPKQERASGQQAIERLIRKLDDDHFRVRALAEKQLIKIGPKVVPMILQSKGKLGLEGRLRAELILKKLQQPATLEEMTKVLLEKFSKSEVTKSPINLMKKIISKLTKKELEILRRTSQSSRDLKKLEREMETKRDVVKFKKANNLRLSQLPQVLKIYAEAARRAGYQVDSSRFSDYTTGVVRGQLNYRRKEKIAFLSLRAGAKRFSLLVNSEIAEARQVDPRNNQSKRITFRTKETLAVKYKKLPRKIHYPSFKFLSYAKWRPKQDHLDIFHDIEVSETTFRSGGEYPIYAIPNFLAMILYDRSGIDAPIEWTREVRRHGARISRESRRYTRVELR